MPETWKAAITYKIQRREVKEFLFSLHPGILILVYVTRMSIIYLWAFRIMMHYP